ncbi:MAG: hypothetical protein HOO67_03845 [Candidatus Peribacteraceae bacterium]|nr:hypothetical protein [Candidatus Peribacteraceae bacterium]
MDRIRKDEFPRQLNGEKVSSGMEAILRQEEDEIKNRVRGKVGDCMGAQMPGGQMY